MSIHQLLVIAARTIQVSGKSVSAPTNFIVARISFWRDKRFVSAPISRYVG